MNFVNSLHSVFTFCARIVAGKCLIDNAVHLPTHFTPRGLNSAAAGCPYMRKFIRVVQAVGSKLVVSWDFPEEELSLLYPRICSF